MKKIIPFFLLVYFVLSSLNLSAQHFYHSLSGNGTFSDVENYKIPANGKTTSAIWYNGNGRLSVTIFMERKDGEWGVIISTANVQGRNVSPYPMTFGHYKTQDEEDTREIYNMDNFVVCYYDQSLGEQVSYDCPSPAEIKARFGRKKQLHWLFCVAEDKETGLVFVSQSFNTSESLSYTQVYNKILNAYKTHVKNILKDNPSLGIPYSESRLSFWIESKSRGYSKATGNGIHLGMNYPQVVDFGGVVTAENIMNKSREGFIKFKNDFGNMDKVYLVDFDYNKIKN